MIKKYANWLKGAVVLILWQAKTEVKRYEIKEISQIKAGTGAG